MSVTATDIIVYASANMPDTDTGTNGGAIDALRRLAFTQISANDTIQAVSTSASDTQNMTVEGRSAAGAIVTETKAMTGTTAITFATLATVERVLKADLASNAIGTVTVRRTTGPVTLATIPIGERGFLAPFRKTASDPSTTKTYYVKGFVKNTHATLSLLSAVINQSADPSAKITHAVSLAVNDSVSAADRVTAPATITFDDTSKAVPGTDLAAGAAIGVWLKLSLSAGDAAIKSTYTLEAAGQST